MRDLMLVQSIIAILLFTCVCFVDAVPAGERSVVLEEDLEGGCIGWTIRNWTNPRRALFRPDEGYVRLEDGLMKVYLGRGMVGKKERMTSGTVRCSRIRWSFTRTSLSSAR